MSWWTAALNILKDVFWFLRRRQEIKDDPKEQNRERYQQIDADIAGGDAAAATEHGLSDLDELDRLQHGKGGAGGSVSKPS
jgi:hypothetical protein